MARVVLAVRARRDLLALSWHLADAIEETLGRLARDPFVGHPLTGRLKGLRSLRVGSYRVIYQLETDRLVRVVAIRHRASAYLTDPR